MDCIAADREHHSAIGTALLRVDAYERCYNCDMRAECRERFGDHPPKISYYTRYLAESCETPEVCTAQRQAVTAVLVEAVGNPVRVLPADAVYRVRVWHGEAPLAEAEPALFCDAAPALDTTLEPTVAAIDMDHSHKQPLTEHAGAIRKVAEAGLYSRFDGVKARRAYLGAFHERFEAYLASDDRVVNPAPNPHVARRRKGHSHARK